MLPADPGADSSDPRVGSLARRLARERAARLEAESIAERATSQLYETVQQLTHAARVADLLSKVTAQANEAASVSEAMAGVLASICAYTGWPVGHALVRSDEQPDAVVTLGVWHLDDTDRLEAFRAKSETMVFPAGTGLPGRALQSGQPVWIPDLQVDGNFPRAREALGSGLAAAFAIPVLSRSETAAVLEFFATSIQQPDPELLEVLGTVGAQLGRVMERDAAERRLTRLALYDGLTGLPNRMLLMDRLRSTLSRAHRNGTPVDVLYLDIDDFKIINDSRGHSTGDAVLSALSSRLKDAIRDSDTVGLVAPSTVARLGGDEFAVILDGCEHPELVAERIGELLKAPLDLPDGQLFITLSMGVAKINLSRAAEGAEDLLAQANLAMHEAKREGKARFIAFEPRMQERAKYRQQLGDELHRAVEKQEFELAYQPVITLEDGRIVGAEALVRWRHPERGMVAPDDFISRSEETGLIVAIGTWVLGEACGQATRWQHRYDAKFTIAVNVSGRQLREPDFTRVVRTALVQTGLPAQTLCLEMTESILMERDDEAIVMLSQLREEGVHLAIDDFGTGYSSLGALRRLPVDLLKIDRSFVSSLPEDEDAGTIAWAIVRLGHTLGMPVLAEGVETQGQLDALRKFGCDQVQGYLLGRPMTAAAFEERLAEQARR